MKKFHETTSHIIKKILKFFKNIYATSGEFTVVGEDSISFEVKCNSPDQLVVRFADCDPGPIPCVPFIPDSFSVEFVHQKGPLSLVVIFWKVSQPRTIAWHIRER